MQDLDKQSMFTTPIQFYDFFLNRVMVTFKPKYEDPDPTHEFELMLSKKNTYDQVRALSLALNPSYCSHHFLHR